MSRNNRRMTESACYTAGINVGIGSLRVERCTHEQKDIIQIEPDR